MSFQKASMDVNTSLTRAEHAEIRSQLRTLRTRLTQARDMLVHFKDDRVDRDKLEPAARRVDDLMDLFVGDKRDTARGSLWLAEIQSGVEEVTNPKATEVLDEARMAISALREVIRPTRESSGSCVSRVVPGKEPS
jgi:hypothetical protein